MTKTQFTRKERRYKRLLIQYRVMKDKNSVGGKALALRLNIMYDELMNATICPGSPS